MEAANNEKQVTIEEVLSEKMTMEELKILSFAGVALANLVPTLLNPMVVSKFFVLLLGTLRTGTLGELGMGKELDEVLQKPTTEVLGECINAYGYLAMKLMVEEGLMSRERYQEVTGEEYFATND